MSSNSATSTRAASKCWYETCDISKIQWFPNFVSKIYLINLNEMDVVV